MAASGWPDRALPLWERLALCAVNADEYRPVASVEAVSGIYGDGEADHRDRRCR